MARIVLITHEYDRLSESRGPFRRADGRYLIFHILQHLRWRGHSWRHARGIDKQVNGDMAILHADATRTPPEYVEYAGRFPLCINIGATDIAKTRISNGLLTRDADWQGPAIVKTALNYRGIPEQRLNAAARALGRPEPFPGSPSVEGYPVYEHLSEVPSDAFDNPDLVVERFMPEKTHDGYALRHWLFMGEAESCVRVVARDRTVKGEGIFRRETIEIPPEIRARRKQFGIDYGKFDFVIHEGKPYLLDANKTPGRPPSAAIVPILAEGLAGIIKRPR